MINLVEYYTSLFLFAIYTGARAHTCCSIQLKNTEAYKEHVNGISILRISLSEMKGFRKKQHPCTFESTNDGPISSNFIKWFRLHLLKVFNLNLSSFDVWDLTTAQKDLYIWPKISNYSKGENIRNYNILLSK
jgi:hypothetical protein